MVGDMAEAWDSSVLPDITLSPRQPVLTPLLFTLDSPPGSRDENGTEQKGTSTKSLSTCPAQREDSATDRAANQDTEGAAEHVDTEACADGTHVGRHGSGARSLQGHEGAGAESVEQSPDHKTPVRVLNGGPAEGKDGS